MFSSLFNVSFSFFCKDVYAQHSNLWSEGSDQMEIGVFTLGDIHKTMLDDLNKACRNATRSGQVLFKQSRIAS